MRAALLLIIAATLAAADGVPGDSATGAVRIKDLCDIYGVRDNQLYGVGLVVGLAGSGDKQEATTRVIRQMLSKFRMSFDADGDLESKNVALVAVTAELPAFARKGARLRTTVSCLGDANSLRGGTLLQTLLVAHDGAVYAAAQGGVSIGGFGDAGPGVQGGGTAHRNIETVAVLTPGAMVEQEIPQRILVGDRLRLVLRQPDFTTASRLARSLSAVFGADRVVAEDHAAVAVRFPPGTPDPEVVAALERIQQMRIDPDQRARVVVNSRTGTVIAGSQVRVSQVAISHAGLSLRVLPKATPDPRDPLGPGSVRWTDPVTRLNAPAPPAGISASTAAVPGTFTVMDGASVEDIATAMNAIGARPRDLVAIFESLDRLGALHAELIVE